MNTNNRRRVPVKVFGAVAGFLLFCVGASDAGMRTWTSTDGDQMEAEFVEVQGDRVVLRAEEGRMLEIRMDRLSPQDQLYIGQQAAGGNRPDEADIPPALEELFGRRLVDAQGQQMSTAELADAEKIGIFFSAEWCPPCRAFTPRLIEAYDQLTAEGRPFEIVFVSSDRSSQDMRKYMRDYEMNWPALRHGDRRANELKSRFGVRGIPRLVIVDSTGEVLSENARGEVTQLGGDAYDRW